jgi:hypothetical protein
MSVWEENTKKGIKKKKVNEIEKDKNGKIKIN